MTGDARWEGAETPALRGFAIVGRDPELGAVVAALSARPAVVLVEGEAGVGKSRLVAEAAVVLRRHGVAVATGGCHALREPLAYGPVVDALRALGERLPARGEAGTGAGTETDAKAGPQVGAAAGALVRLLPELADRLPSAPTDDPGPGEGRHRILNGVRALLTAAAPVVLVVEDMHWADEATRELLHLLARDLPADCGLVLTYRGEEQVGPVLAAPFRRPPGTSGTELSLARLDEDALAEMARSALGADVTAELVATLFERSAGLPLIIEEDLITLSGPGAGGRPDLLGVPRSLREVLETRIARLSPEAVAVVNAAAVLAVPAGAALLGATAGLDQGPAESPAGQGPDDRVDGALLAALASYVLIEHGPDSYGFSHALARRAVYDTLPGPLRTRLHRRALALLTAQEPPPLVQIAHHSRALGDLESWLEHAEAAAEQARAVGDLGTTITLLSQIIDHPGLPAGQLSAIALTLANTVQFSIDATHMISTLRRIISTPGLPPAARGEIRAHLGNVLLNQAGDPAGLVEMEKAAVDLEADNPALAARTMSVLAVADTGEATTAERQAWLDRAYATLERTTDEAARAIVHCNHVTFLLNRADPRIPALLAELPRQAEDPRILRATAIALSGAAEAAFCVGLDARVPALNDESLAISRSVHLSALDSYAESYRLLLTWAGGQWQQWELDLAAYRSRFPDGPLIGTGLLGAAQGITAAARGHSFQAAAHFDRVTEHDPTDILTLPAAAGAARLWLARGDADAAWRLLATPLRVLRDREVWPFAFGLLPTAVETALLRGDRAGADGLAEEHGVGIAGCESPGGEAEQHLCRGLLLNHEEGFGAAYEEFDRARALWTGIGRPYPAALAAERAALARASADPAGAAARLADATAVFDRLGAVVDSSRCHRHLRTLGQHRPARRGRRGYGAELSPREQQVADLLAEGATNREIADALSLSPRTAEHHVAGVLRKLAATRDELRRPRD